MIRDQKRLNSERRKITRRKFGMTVLAGAAAAMTPKAAHAATPDFTVAVIPDTQYLTTYCGEAYTEMMTWIVNNRSANQGGVFTMNTKAVIGVGDCTQGAEHWPFLWAAQGYQAFDRAGIPWIDPIGNHDYASNSRANGPGEGFTSPDGYFSANQRSLASYGSISGGGTSAWVGHYDQVNYCVSLIYGTRSILLFALEYQPRAAVMTWARGISDANAGFECIISTHSFLSDTNDLSTYSGESGNIPASNDNGGAGLSTNQALSDANFNSGYGMWNNHLINWPNLTLVLCGHFIYSSGSAGTKPSWFHQQKALKSTSSRAQTVQSVMGNWQDIEAGNYTSNIPGGGAPANSSWCGSRSSVRAGHAMFLNFRPSAGLLDIYAMATSYGRWETTWENRNTAPSTTPNLLYRVPYTGLDSGAGTGTCSVDG
jgi:hypothetical protein